MRDDSIGFFWEDFDKKQIKQEEYLREKGWDTFRGKWYKTGNNPEVDYTEDRYPIAEAYKIARKIGDKCEPPEPLWENDDYLPNLEDARTFNYVQLTDQELIEEVNSGTIFECDIECYRNYFLIAFRSFITGGVVFFESHNDSQINLEKLLWLLKHCEILTFNGKGYDEPMAILCLAGLTNTALKDASDMIIQEGLRPKDLYTLFSAKKIKINHIDIMNVCPQSASLKLYGGRAHAERLQDLPFRPDKILNNDQALITRWYCINDLKTTGLLLRSLMPEMMLRLNMSKQYNVDLRSKSDAQIAESVIGTELKRLTGFWPKKAIKDYNELIDKWCNYFPPNFLVFKSELMHYVLQTIVQSRFDINPNSGKPTLPDAVKALKIEINNTRYKLGIGGLHSQEKSVSYYSDNDYTIVDCDVTSYYPMIILNNNLFPQHLGIQFLKVYNEIVQTRIAAKKSGNKTAADSLKIVINGTFGKFGSIHSIVYSPQLLLQVTITGQLSLLLLIERLELAGIHVVSANTDGIVIKKPKARVEEFNSIIHQWEVDTGFNMEETVYRSIHSRDVNNYIAVKEDGKTKEKGAYADPGLSKNPTCRICSLAVAAYLARGANITNTVMQHQRVQDFVTVRTVRGGAVKDGEFLGKVVRFYYSSIVDGTIIYANTGNKVPRTEGARPFMLMGNSLPEDLDHNWYIEECYSILKDLGVET